MRYQFDEKHRTNCLASGCFRATLYILWLALFSAGVTMSCIPQTVDYAAVNSDYEYVYNYTTHEWERKYDNYFYDGENYLYDFLDVGVVVAILSFFAIILTIVAACHMQVSCCHRCEAVKAERQEQYQRNLSKGPIMMQPVVVQAPPTQPVPFQVMQNPQNSQFNSGMQIMYQQPIFPAFS